MRHAGDWIRLDGAPGDTSDATLFIEQLEGTTPLSYMRPADTSAAIYADNDTGELNVKNSGFKMYFDFEVL